MKTTPAVSNINLQEKREQLLGHVCGGRIHDFDFTKFRGVATPIECEDGFTISVQASDGHYCTPRKLTDWYTALELGYPSEPDDLILQYAEDPDSPTQTVYGYVPIDCVIALLDKHGGPKRLDGVSK